MPGSLAGECRDDAQWLLCESRYPRFDRFDEAHRMTKPATIADADLADDRHDHAWRLLCEPRNPRFDGRGEQRPTCSADSFSPGVSP
jgi:hypothetical protein